MFFLTRRNKPVQQKSPIKDMSPTTKQFLSFFLAALFMSGAAPVPADDIVEAARDQIGKTIYYDPSYRALDYPEGDIPIERGVCADVVIRAFRQARDIDLQKLVHEDMTENFSQYPKIWGLSRPDRNIDHRRVPNLQALFERKGWAVDVPNRATGYRAGDLVTCTVPTNLPHIMIVSDKKNRQGIPFVIHNIGQGTQEEDRLFEFELTGHYRLPERQAALQRKDK